MHLYQYGSLSEIWLFKNAFWEESTTDSYKISDNYKRLIIGKHGRVVARGKEQEINGHFGPQTFNTINNNYLLYLQNQN